MQSLIENDQLAPKFAVTCKLEAIEIDAIVNLIAAVILAIPDFMEVAVGRS